MPRCKNCKQQFTPVSFNRKFCMSNECNDLFYEELKKDMFKKWSKDKKIKKENLQTVQELMKLTQIVFNKYIRERDKDKPCISCLGTNLKKVNAGHYFSSGGHKNVTFNEDNVHLQCEYCNTFLHGNLIPYRTNLIERIGLERVKELESIAYHTRKFTRDELKEITVKYKKKLKELKKV